MQGRVAFPNNDLDDFVILRSDGTPTYMLAVVVDDHDMGVTHIIRGDDHLTNGGRQKILYDALGWPVPEMAHIPLIHGPDGAKLSKRHGALGVDAYRAMGYLPEAMRNYLARLGWSHGDDEIMSTDEMIGWFDTADINRAPARFDFAKLASVNAHYMRAMDDGALLDDVARQRCRTCPAATSSWRSSTTGAAAQLLAAMPLLKDRAKTLLDLIDRAAFIVADAPAAARAGGGRADHAEAKAMLAKLAAAAVGTGRLGRRAARGGGEAIRGNRGHRSSARLHSRCVRP